MVFDAYNMMVDDRDKVIKEKTSCYAHWDGTEKFEMKCYLNDIPSTLLKTSNF